MEDNLYPLEVDQTYEKMVEASQPRPRYVIRDMAYHMRPLPPREWRIEGLAAVGNVILFSAWTGDGKTWVTYEAIISHALGRPWMGFNTVQGPCLIINEEMDDYDISLRLAMCNRAQFGDESTPVKTISFARFNLFSERTKYSDAEAIENAILEAGAEFVLIDSLSDIMQGGDENAVKDTQPVFMMLSDIAKHTKSVIMVIHHTGKNGTTRGSSAIPGAVDLAIIAKRSADGSQMEFETEKARIIPHIKWSAKMIWTDDQFHTERIDNANIEPELGKAQNYVMRYLKEHGPATVKDITGSADSCTPASAKQAVYSLAGLGMIKRTNPGASPMVAAIYAIVEVSQDD